MCHPPDVRLVDAHSERHGRRHDQPVLGCKAFLNGAPVGGVHAAVVVTGRVPVLAQRGGKGFGFRPRRTVHNSRLAPAHLSKVKDLPPRLLLRCEREVDVRPVKSSQKRLRRGPREKPCDDLVPRLGIRRRGKRGERHTECRAQISYPQVIRPEVVAPLADAMRLVHSDQANPDAPEKRQRPGRGQPLRREVQDLQ